MQKTGVEAYTFGGPVYDWAVKLGLLGSHLVTGWAQLYWATIFQAYAGGLRAEELLDAHGCINGDTLCGTGGVLLLWRRSGNQVFLHIQTGLWLRQLD